MAHTIYGEFFEQFDSAQPRIVSNLDSSDREC